jgi:hypothetical protein
LVLLGNKHEARRLAQNAIDEQEKQRPLFNTIRPMFFNVEKDALIDEEHQFVGGAFGTLLFGALWPLNKTLDAINKTETADALVSSHFNRAFNQELCQIYRVALPYYDAKPGEKHGCSQYIADYCKRFLQLPDDNPIFTQKIIQG